MLNEKIGQVEHTPETWRLGDADSEWLYLYNAPACLTENIVAAVKRNKDGAFDRVRLISAAPDLLAAVQAALDFIHSMPYEPSISPSTKLQDALVDAIAKATGENEVTE